jgi:hypothetical protein
VSSHHAPDASQPYAPHACFLPAIAGALLSALIVLLLRARLWLQTMQMVRIQLLPLSSPPALNSPFLFRCTPATDVYNPVSGYCSQTTCPGNFFTLTSIQSCAVSSRPEPSPPFKPSPDELSCAGRACGWPGSTDNAAAAGTSFARVLCACSFQTLFLGVAAFILCFILSVLQPYIVLSFHAHRIILSKRDAAQASAAR